MLKSLKGYTWQFHGYVVQLSATEHVRVFQIYLTSDMHWEILQNFVQTIFAYRYKFHKIITQIQLPECLSIWP